MKLSTLIVRRALQGFAGGIKAHPLLRWRYTPAGTDRLLVAPQDLRTTDATRASEIYGGRFAFAGKVVICDRRSPFEMTPPSDEWAVTLLGFGWLRHLRAADSAITRSNARALVEDWISIQGGWHKTGWRIDILSRRIISWLSQAPLVLQDADAKFYRRFIRSLARQARYLRHTVRNAPDGAVRIQALVALCLVALCMDGQSRQLRPMLRRLTAELDRQILPDGGHISRNPGTLIDILLDLLPLRQVLAHRNVPPPAGLNNSIDRMMPMLRFFRLGDGNFGQFNGMGPTPVDLLATVLAYDDARGAPVANAPHSGYQRLETGDTVMLMDTGKPPPLSVSQDGHAGCLSFETSWKRHRLIVNCGLPAMNRENWRQVARTTAAHSTVTFNDTSSAQLGSGTSFRRLLGGIPIVGGPHRVATERHETQDGIILSATHDGYAREFGILHRRVLRLAADGREIHGEDNFLPAHGDSLPKKGADDYAIRFHLHPAVKANRLTDGHGVMLTLPDRDVWTFDSHGYPVEIEESVYLAGPDGPRRTVQIVMYGQARARPRAAWSFQHTPRASQGARRYRTDEPELPLEM
ncbi:MAG: heparinase II/III family protein [Xanthobacteraceae bacterium]